MKLNLESWHYKLYAFDCQMVAALWDESNPHEYPQHGRIIGLCPYMRMILIWGPLTLLLQLSPWAAAIGAVCVLPMYVIGSTSWITLVLSIIAIIGLAIGAWMLMRYITDAVDTHRTNKQESLPQIDPFAEPKPDTFWTMTVAYLRSAKTRICPILEIDDE